MDSYSLSAARRSSSSFRWGPGPFHIGTPFPGLFDVCASPPAPFSPAAKRETAGGVGARQLQARSLLRLHLCGTLRAWRQTRRQTEGCTGTGMDRPPAGRGCELVPEQVRARRRGPVLAAALVLVVLACSPDALAYAPVQSPSDRKLPCRQAGSQLHGGQESSDTGCVPGAGCHFSVAPPLR